jgi:hypothetical protein
MNSEIRNYTAVAMARLRSCLPLGEGIDTLDSVQRVLSPVTKIIEILSFDGLSFSNLKTDEVARQFVGYWSKYCSGNYQNANRRAFNMSSMQIENLIYGESMDYINRLKEFIQVVYPNLHVSDYDWARTQDCVYFECIFGRLVKTFKVLINDVFANYFETEHPKSVPGSVGKYIFPRALNVQLKRTVLHRKSRKSRHMSEIYTLFQGLKKGLLPIRPDAVDESLISHKNLLTMDIPISGELKWFVSDTLIREFGDLPITGKTQFKRNCIQSNHSTFMSTRANGGQIGTALRLRDLSREQFLLGGCRLPGPPEFFGYVEEEEVWTSNATGEILFRERSVSQVHGDYLWEEDLHHYLNEARDSGLIPIHIATPCVILEPLKGRIITKPSDGDYLDYVEIQNHLWKTLQKRREFQLIGRPVEDTDIYHVAGSWEIGKGFNSGDFSGATDNLSGHLSNQILRFILSYCGEEFKNKCLESFCNAKIDYRNNPMNEQDSPWLEFYDHFRCTDQNLQRQTNGQLMGHILSFPILCIANYIMFRYTYWKMEREAPNVLINGDDILFCATKEEYEEWKVQTNKVGLVPSLGKNLFQTDIAQINSVLFDIRFATLAATSSKFNKLELEDADFKPFVRDIRPVPFVNFGVLTGRGKGKEDPFERVSMSECTRELDEIRPELISLHSVMKLWDYTDKYFDRSIIKQVFYKHRPITRKILQEVESWNPLVVARLYKKSGSVDRLPGNSTSVFRSVNAGEWEFKPRVAVREFNSFPLMFDERTLTIVERVKRV